MKRAIAFICAFALLLGISIPALAADFTDVPTGAWYAEDVAWCREHGIMSGTGNDTFSPNINMSRAMLAAVLYRAAGSPTVTGKADFPMYLLAPITTALQNGQTTTTTSTATATGFLALMTRLPGRI